MAIRSDSDPQNDSQRLGAPKGELEQYGVWVKAEPQDIAEEIASAGSTSSDFDLAVDTASVPEESFLSEDEEKLLGTFDTDFEIQPSPNADLSGPLPDIEDMPPLEESFDVPEPLVEEVDDIASKTIDISLDQFESSRPPSDIHPGAEIDMSSVEGLEAPGEEMAAPRPSSAPAASSAIEDVSSEFLDLAEEPGAEAASEFGSELDDVTSEFLDVENAAVSPSSLDTSSEFEPLDIDLRFEDQVPAPAAAPRAEVEPGYEAVTEFDDFLTSDTSASQKADFDDVTAVERELSTPSEAPAERTARPAAASADLSTEILLKIANELSSIRSELVSLKSQIVEVVHSAETSPPKAVETTEPEITAEAGPSGGFFDDEEDETIALTGDELDNILNTADFTEEIAEAEEPLDLETDSMSAEPQSPSGLGLLDESLLPETGEYPSPSEPAIEEVRIGQEDSVDEIPELQEEPEALDLVADLGVTPMTPAPEDTSYLENPDIGFDGEDASISDNLLGEADFSEAELGEIPLADEPLVEPDLTELNLEAEDLEPRLEIEEELPLASAEAPPEDITLGMEAGPDYSKAEEGAAEAEFLEPVSEIEEANFSEINLHEEDLATAGSASDSDVTEIEALSDSDFSSLEPVADLESPIEEEGDVLLTIDEEPATPKPQKPTAKAAPASPAPVKVGQASSATNVHEDDQLKTQIKKVLTYLDDLLGALPEDKIEEFAQSEHFETYKRLFKELGLV